MEARAAIVTKTHMSYIPAWVPKTLEIKNKFQHFCELYDRGEFVYKPSRYDEKPADDEIPFASIEFLSFNMKVKTPEQMLKQRQRNFQRTQNLKKRNTISDSMYVHRRAFVQYLQQNPSEAQRLLGDPIEDVSLSQLREGAKKMPESGCGDYSYLSEEDLFTKKRKGIPRCVLYSLL